MTSVVLLGYLVALGGFGARLVAGRGWARSAPRVALGVWAVLVVALTVSVVMLGVSLVVPMVPVSTDLAAVLRACVLALQQRYASPGGAVVATVGLALTAGWVLRLCWSVGLALRGAGVARCRLEALLALVGQPDPELGAVVVAHEVATVFCLPGRPGTIVFSSAARRVLAGDHALAVMAHESAHLRGRHHLLVAVTTGVTDAFPRVPLLAGMAAQVAQLVELIADDAAARQAGRSVVAAALARVAGTSAPAAALGAGAQGAPARVARLLGPPPKAPGRAARGVLLAGAVIAVAAPLLLAVLPALLVGHPEVCSFGVPYGTGPCLPV